MYLFILSMKNTTQEVNKVKIFTAVSEGIKNHKKEYMRALEKLAKKNDTFLIDAADKNTYTARQLILKTKRFKVTLYCARHDEIKYDEQREELLSIFGAPGERLFEKKRSLARDADAGLFLWYRYDYNICTDILSLIVQGKPVTVIDSYTGKSRVIKSIDDLIEEKSNRYDDNRYVCMNGFLNKKDYNAVIETFIPSREMADFLKNNPVTKKQVIDIIINAPVSIEKKANFFYALEQMDDCDKCRELINVVHEILKKNGTGGDINVYQIYQTIKENRFGYHLEETKRAIHELENVKQSEVLLIHTMEYPKYSGIDGGLDAEDSDETIPVWSRNGVKKYMFFDEYYTERWGYEFETYWYEAVKWTAQAYEKRGMPVKSYRYIFRYDDYKETDDYTFNDHAVAPATVMFFDKCVLKSNINVPEEAAQEDEPVPYAGNRNMDPLPIPFKPGDVLGIDCTPFLPHTYVLLLDPDNEGKNIAQILYLDECGLWQRGVLDRDFGFGYYRPRLSCFYRLVRYKGPMTVEELPEDTQKKFFGKPRLPERGNILKRVSEYIHENPGRGSELAEKMFSVKKGGLSDDELLDMIGGKA